MIDGNLALSAQEKAERERDHAWETCKRALHKVDNLIARAEKAEKDRDAAEVERDDAIRTAQDNAEEVEKLKAQLAAALTDARADAAIACTALCPHGLDIAAQYENAKRDLAEAQKDVKRYSWLKATMPSVLHREVYLETRGKHGLVAVMEACKANDVDAAIDEALTVEK